MMSRSLTNQFLQTAACFNRLLLLFFFWTFVCLFDQIFLNKTLSVVWMIFRLWVMFLMMDRQPPMTHLVKNARLRLTQTQTDTRQTQVNLPKVFVCLDPEGYLLRRLLSCLSVSSLETGMTWYDTSRSARDDRQISLSATNRTLKVTLKLSLISLSSRSTAKEKKTSVLGKEGSFYGRWLDMRFADSICDQDCHPCLFFLLFLPFPFFLVFQANCHYYRPWSRG